MAPYQPATSNLLPYGIALIRVVVGIVFFVHGVQKWFQMGIGGVEGFFGMLGIPAPALAAVVVSTVELVGGLALILGVFTRIAGVLVAIDVIVATLVFHRPNGFFITDNGIEFTLVLAATGIGLAMTGPGVLALDEMLPFERWFRATPRPV